MNKIFDNIQIYGTGTTNGLTLATYNSAGTNTFTVGDDGISIVNGGLIINPGQYDNGITIYENTVSRYSQAWANSLDCSTFQVSVSNDTMTWSDKSGHIFAAFNTNGGYTNNAFGSLHLNYATAKVHIQGDTSDNSTYAFKVQNDSEVLLFSIRNDGVIYSGATPLQSIFAPATGAISGTLTSNYLPVANGTNSITDSIIFQTSTGVTVNGSINILGNVNVLGTASTFDTQTIQAESNLIVLNYSGSSVSAVGGGMEIISGKTDGAPATWTINSVGTWSANTPGIFTGLRADSNSNTFQTFNSAGTSTLLIKDDGYLSINNGLLNIYSDSGYATLDSEYPGIELKTTGSLAMKIIDGGPTSIYPALQIGSGLYGGASPLSIGLSVAGTNGLSEISVQNIALDSTSAAIPVSAIGKQGTSITGSSATMRFSYVPASFGASIDSSDPNYYRIGIGTDVDLNYRVTISNGLKVSGITIIDTGSTYGAGKFAISDANGSISFSSATALGISTTATTVTKYATTTTLSSTGTTITHGLNTNYIICAFYDATGNPVIPGFQRTGVNTISVSAATTGNYDIVIHG